MRISVFGMGYVGTVSASCFADSGCHVIGVDTDQSKVNLISEGKSPIVEKDIDRLIAAAHENGRLTATTDVQAAIDESDISLVCVGTPSRDNGSLNLDYVTRVCEQLGNAISIKGTRHHVVIRSTLLPGSTENCVIPALNSSSAKVGELIGLAINPEFLREGTAVMDFLDPPKTVVGVVTQETANAVMSLFAGIPGPKIEVPYSVAECVKYVDNVWHALKVAFANEVGRIGRAINVDSREVMNVFKQDLKLNISDKYLQPGFAFGGSCLPKDVRAFNYLAKSLDVEVPIIGSIMASNRSQLDQGIRLIQRFETKIVGVLGFAFKAGTDDMRESPCIDTIEYLLGKGYQLKIFDSSVNVARLSGMNRDTLFSKIPHIEELMVTDVDELFIEGSTVVIGNNAAEVERVRANQWSRVNVVDLVGAVPLDLRKDIESYVAPGWM